MKTAILTVLLALYTLFQPAAPTNVHVVAGLANPVVVNWQDTLGYHKPVGYAVTEPSCNTPTPNYYVDLATGSGTTCSQGSPCALTGLGSKSGMAGGPACVWLRGIGGNVQIFSPTLNYFGSPGAEILLQPWPGQTAPVFQTNGNQTLDGTGGKIHDWIFDGGPDMQITFKTMNANSGTGSIGIRANADNLTFYRIRGTCDNNLGGNIIITTAAGVDNLKIINSEFYDCNAGQAASQQSAVYMSSDVCNGVSSYTNFEFRNNIVRNMAGEGIEINARTASSGAIVDGNVFYDIGFTTCGNGAWSCRPAITQDSCGGIPAGSVFSNNVIWHIAASCAWIKSGTGSFYNNTCYDYGTGSGFTSNLEGVASGNTSNVPVVRNNIIVALNGRDPFDHAFAGATNNMCASGETCGTSAQTYNASTTFSSLSTSSLLYLTLGGSSGAANSGATLASVPLDFLGLTRPRGASYDIGAFER